MRDYSELKRLAEAATQGTWTHLKHGVIKGGPAVQFTNGSSQQQIVMTTGADWMKAGEQYANADFIAAANPAAVLALIAENERLSMTEGGMLDRDMVRHSLECQQKADKLSVELMYAKAGFSPQDLEIHRLTTERDQLRAEVDGLKTGYEAYERVNAELEAECEVLRKDVDRYRWLRNDMNSVAITFGVHSWEDLSGEFMDSAIDAAMLQGEQS